MIRYYDVQIFAIIWPLNLFLLSEKNKLKLIKKTRLIFKEVVELFKYKKNNEEY